MYENELKALKKSGRFRERKVFNSELEDMASNDYLGLSNNKKQFKKAVKMMEKYDTLTSKASMLVNGYHPIHQKFEQTMAQQNGFEEGIVVGSGFLANMALIEALVRKNDKIFIDESYHASGMMASELIKERVIFFNHNDSEDLRFKLKKYSAKRQIVAVEGVYSMRGDLCPKEIFDVVEEKACLMIVDEAHSSGVIGKKLLGIFEYYDIKINERHIKMGTLGKAYGSYGAYILASSHIVSFLINRGKPIIYSTSPSVFDTALALVNLHYIQKKSEKLQHKIKKRQKIVNNILGITLESLILPVVMPTNEQTLSMQKKLLSKGYLVGAIRQPTVTKPIMRVILNLSANCQKIVKTLQIISDKQIQ